MTAEEIVQIQLDTYNNRDIEGFVACYDKQVALYNYGEDLPYATGIFALKSMYGRVFANSPDLHSKLVKRIVFDNKVIDHEHVTGRLGIDLIDIVAIYEVENGLIAKVTFIRKK